MSTIAEAEARIVKQLSERAKQGQSSFVTNVDLVLCEDFESVMIYVDVADELDAGCACFDLPDGMPFDPEALRDQMRLGAEALH